MPRPLILCYHAVSSSWPSPLAVSEELLEEHVDALCRRGYRGATFSDAVRTDQRKSVVFTFDDAYASTLIALPILAAAGFPGTVFAVSSFAESQRLLTWPGIAEWAGSPHAHELQSLSWAQLGELQEAGWEVGSHTVTHPTLPSLEDAALQEELSSSRAAISERLGTCAAIAYPYGRADERVAAAAAAAGYTAGCTLTRLPDVDEPLRRPRVGMYPADVPWRFAVKRSPAARVAAAARLRRRG